MVEHGTQNRHTETASRLKAEQNGMAQRPDNDDHANEGMISIPFEDLAPSGAFDAEGHRPVLERSRKVR